jgi:hypothetical protein
MNKIYQNNLQLPKQLTKNQLEVLKMQLIKLNLHNKLLLTINKRIHNYPHTKINNKMGNSFNQSITYNFSKNNGTNSNIILKNINSNKENIFKYNSINNSARIGIINFVIKIISSIFNSLYCIIAKPQFINKHNKLIIRIPYYQNNIKKDSLITNTNSNRVFNLLTNNLSNNNNQIIINNMLKNNNSINITKNSIIKWLKDYLNLNTDNLNNKIIDLNTIDNYIKNDKIIDNKTLNNNNNNNYNLKGKISRKTNLLMKIANSNKLDYLNTKRLSNLKITSNKLLMLKIIKNLNYNNDNSNEILGKGTISHPVSINTLNKLFGGVFDSNAYLGNFNFVNEYKLISTKLLAINLLNNKTNIKNAYSKEIDSLNKLSKNKLMINLKLINKINQNIFNLKSQFTEKKNDSINFILNNIIKQYNPNILFYNTLLNNSNNSTFNLILLNRQLSLINKLGIKLLNFNKINNTSISILNNNNNNTSNINNAKFNLNVKIIKLIIKNNMILANTFKNNSNNSNNSNISNISVNKIYNLDELNILNNKIKEALLSFEFYNNKAHNNSNIIKNNIIKFKSLGILLSKIFNKNISIELIRLWNVGLEPSILSNIISKNSFIDNFPLILKKLFKKISIYKENHLLAKKQNYIINDKKLIYGKINSKEIMLLDKAHLNLAQINDFNKNILSINTNPFTLAKPVGLSIKVAGRLAKERIVPKKTTKLILNGSIKSNKGKIVDSYKFTGKNKRGSYTISVKLAQARTFSTFTSR